MFSSQELAEVHDLMRRLFSDRCNPEVMDKVYLTYRIEDQTVILCEVRPSVRDPAIKSVSDDAKFTFVRSRGVWKLYWMRANMKWARYEPARSRKSLRAILKVVDQDERGCFFG
jgi:hypothetical protein